MAARCLRPDCTKPARGRGLCVDCYTRAKWLIQSGKTTWQSLYERGKAVPPYEWLRVPRNQKAVPCDRCGKSVTRVASQIERRTHHFCSVPCWKEWWREKNSAQYERRRQLREAKATTDEDR